MNLNGNWQLYFYKNGSAEINCPNDLVGANVQKITATVPGNVELDLSRAGYLPKDLFMGMNITEAEQYEIYDWWYETSFTPNTPKDGESVILKFGAVDCVADYFLNGEKIGHTENMLLENIFDITDKAVYGKENTLHVHIFSPVIYGDEQNIEPFELAYSWHTSAVSQTTRKAPHSYGWDIMPRAVSAGIWRDVTLEYKPQYGFDFAYFNVHYISDTHVDAQLIFKTRLPKEDIFAHRKMRIHGSCNGKTIDVTNTVYSSAGKFVFPIDYDTLWWPRNYGKQNMYDLTVEVYNRNGELLFSEDFRQGFRSVELARTDIVQKDGKFELLINNKKVVALGSNWVPMDAYHSRDKERYQKAIDLAVDCGCNILRCWGGNVYEDTEFFNLCDENGIMVWQDFAMACHFYPQNPDFAEKIAKEVTAVVKKLRNHVSIVLWCGDNEVDSMICCFKGHPNAPKPSVNRLTREVIPALLTRLDPKRPYIASSPYTSDEAYDLGSEYYPEDHLWGPRDYFKSNFYTRSNAYFVSETGYHGCPNKESIEKFITPEKIWPYFDNEEWNLHSTDQRNSEHRVMLMHKQVAQLFGEVPTDMDDYILASQISQAEAKKFFIERVRARADKMGGVIWWNLLDGWPQMSDAVVDYYYSKKLAYYFIKRSSRPVIAMIDEMGSWGHPVLVSNCSNISADVTVKITDAASGKEVFNGSCHTEPNQKINIGQIDLMYSAQGMFIIEYTVNSEAFINTYLYGAPKYNLSDYKEWLKAVEKAEEKIK